MEALAVLTIDLDKTLMRYRNLRVAPDFSVNLSNTGLQLMTLGDFDAALNYFDRALLMDVGSSIAHFNRGLVLAKLNRYQEEFEAYEQAIALGMSTLDLHHNRGLALYNLRQPELAVAAFDTAIKFSDDQSRAILLNSRGLALYDLGRYDEARSDYQQALQLKPDYVTARLNLGIVNLASGLWLDGWKDYEFRWEASYESERGSYRKPASALPQWRGESVGADDRLLVFAEQGFGDALQFSRFLETAAQGFSHVTFVCPPALQRLFKASFDGIDVIEALPVTQEFWKWQCPLLSLPLALSTELSTLPALTPYVHVPHQELMHWQARLDTLNSQALCVGLAWAGSSELRRDAARSIEPAILRGLLKTESIQWVSLQKSEHLDTRYVPAHRLPLHDWTDELNDFADTAALISSLDLVITVDTAVAHLAGALGKPVWLLNRFESEWRWMRDRVNSPWYPTMRIFSQRTAGNWDDVLFEVQTALGGYRNAILNERS